MLIVAEFQKDIGNFSSPVNPVNLKSMFSSLNEGQSILIPFKRFSQNG